MNRSLIITRLLLAITGACLLCFPTISHAGTDILVGRKVATAQQIPMDQVDHSEWNQLLSRYVDRNGNVNYTAWKASTKDVAALNKYLNTLSTASVSASTPKPAQLAFWINAYNALTIHGILREYPTTSIRNHTAKLFGYNIWDNLLLHVGDTTVSLNQIEHDILRKMDEPRIHFAIVCASRSCPRLMNVAYTADTLEKLLDLNTRVFFSNPMHFHHNVAKRSFELSSILKWFGEDFGSDQATQLRAIAVYLPTVAAKQAALSNNITVSYQAYDWSLNDQ